VAVIYPDIEKLLVAHLDAALADIYGAGEVRVGTKKAPADSTQPAREVVIVGQYSGSLDDVRAQASAVIDVYADQYETASELGLLCGALVVDISKEHIKRAVVSLGPVRLVEESTQEKRSLSVDLVVKGAPL
jgi:hypothetical protein